MCAKSQSDDGAQSVDDVIRNFREVFQVSYYRHALEQEEIVKHYIQGDLALVLDLAPRTEIEPEGPMTWNRVALSGDDIPILILYHDVVNPRQLKQWGKQPVLIPNVQIVKENDKTIPVLVRLYFGNDPIKEFRTKNVYFSIFERTFYVIPSLPNGEFGVLIKDGRGMDFNGSEISVFNGHPQIVNSVPDDESHDAGDFADIRRRVLNCFATSLIRFDRGNVSLWQTGDNCLKVRNMFVGPFNFESGSSEAVHSCDSTGDGIG
jgi:hypothetical protein